MEYLDGISLKRYIQKKGKLDTETALTILHPVISSLGAVHERGLIHRDISPDNILITRNSEVKLIDFGASKSCAEDEKSVSIVLKQGFAPEEQYRTHGVQGPWSDIYALAVTVYFSITGQLPPESIQRLYEDTIALPSALGSDIKPFQEKALMKALAVHAKDRYKSMRDFERDIYGFQSRTSNEQTPVVSEDAEYRMHTAKPDKNAPTLERIPGAQKGTQIEKKNAPSQREEFSVDTAKDGNPDNVRTKKVKVDNPRKIKRIEKNQETSIEQTDKNNGDSILSELFISEDEQ